ncbi:hypothetical protein SYNTR_0250 [Candidatus Syntrophocurvum alkaliphilum]|uniref:Uncharacterized protein n=1 Tax=Candidatus Syntrophocurvum alkaliphilum TaxID=2293317 RepID=A0A6I6D6I9_9FIRM|nr:hypothetical protein [Candidatus Syntrophocurvum alkaliphilum]QGT98843.1 hypothetical protein SYNTR_0250 [Candidatus Syntrophocurvum alkaliphilum]
MNTNLKDNKNYIENLNIFIEKLSNEIEAKITNSLTNSDIDNYIYEINTFYYKSFHEEFFPFYKKQIEKDISTLYGISRQEDMIKKDIMANIKRYAKLYNQLKSITSVLSESYESVNSHLLKIIREQDKRTYELLYALKKVEDSLIELDNLIKLVNEFHKDKDLINILNKYPGHVSAVKLFNIIDMSDSKQAETINKLLINLQYNIKLLVKIQVLNDNFIDNASLIISELKENTLNLLKEKTPANLQIFYEHHLKNQFLMYLELLTMYIKVKDKDKVIKISQEFEDWLVSFVKLIEKTVVYETNEKKFLLDNISQVIQLDFAMISKLQSKNTKTSDKIKNIINDLSDSSEPDLDFFTKHTIDELSDVTEFFNMISNNPVLKSFGIISSATIKVNMELSLLETKLNLLKEKVNHSTNVTNQFLNIINILNVYLNTLSNIRGDLERLLAPRNINRTWKDINIRVERIQIEKDKEFPSDYLYLLDKARIETKISPNVKPNTVLHEEGDIFIITVDENIEEEVPYIVVSA